MNEQLADNYLSFVVKNTHTARAECLISQVVYEEMKKCSSFVICTLKKKSLDENEMFV